MRMPRKMDKLADHILYIMLIGSIAFLVSQLIRGFRQFILNKYTLLGTDTQRARTALTQSRIFERVLLGAVFILATGIILMSFEQVRRIGISLLASAGLAGIILGFSAQKTLSMIFAGIQIALGQPVRLHDVVIIEGQYGKIEEINLTNIVVTTWDQRQLVVPVNYFIDKPFENWTRSGTELMGAVFIFADYTLPIDVVRQAAMDFVSTHPLWDGRVVSLKVTDSKENTMQIRVAVSAADADNVFDLRCEVREFLITFIRDNYPQCLPQQRMNNIKAG